jgi:energy-coupling factor transporter ATP-binding protein EcfA2
MSQKNLIQEIINNLRQRIQDLIEIGDNFNQAVDEHHVFEKILKYLESEKEVLLNDQIRENYQLKIKTDLNNIFDALPFRNNDLKVFKKPNQPNLKHVSVFENSLPNVENQFNNLSFNINFFKSINFLKENIVAVGANGSGKTTFANHIRTTIGINGVVVSSQRLLKIPTFNSLPSQSKTIADLKSYQNQEKTYKNENDYNSFHNEFSILLQNLIADDVMVNRLYAETASNLEKNGQPICKPPISMINRTFAIWSDLIGHRELLLSDGINITVRPDDGGQDYPAIKMSEGEKVALYLISQVIQAPQDGFIIIDEPEMHLHKSILDKIWNRLEQERQDCIFIYFTHDLDFSISRTLSKKLWVKSFTPPACWDIRQIPSSEIPEELILNILGSRKKVLFCEGVKEGNDVKIYQSLFPDFTVIPVSSCSDVINYTKSYNQIEARYSEAYGLIDSDFRSQEEITALKGKKVFTLPTSELESLFMLEGFISLLAKRLVVNDFDIEELKKDVLAKFSSELELQVSNYLTSKINYLLNSSNLEKSKTTNEVTESYNKFLQDMKIDAWKEERSLMLKSLIDQSDYFQVLKFYNNKGLKQIANTKLRIKDFIDKAINFIKVDPAARDVILSSFPAELK